mmetsp:Transcript_26665/g.48000  ORF Transcript_26665/g.48000 Transcript_26665/m.48000 type:complete len:740 (-) Transcript_26665:25-2244(-)
MIKSYAQTHFEDTHDASVSKMLVELVSSVRRLASNTTFTELLEESEIPQLMTALLGSTHPIITRSALEALVAMMDKPALLGLLETTSIVELCLKIVNDFEGEYVILAASLLTRICRNDEMSRQVRVLRGTLTVFTKLTRTKDQKGLLTLMMLIGCLAADMDNVKEFRKHGLVIELIKIAKKEPDSVTKISALNLLSQLARDDETALLIRVQGLKTLCKLMCQMHEKNLSGEEITEVAYEIQLYTLKCLRFIYSVERNRKIFRKIFPSIVFGPFVDIGNYVDEMKAYQDTFERFKNLTAEELKTIENNVSMLKEASSQPMKVVGGYSIVEVIGKGGYGVVYEAKRGDNKYALKELPLNEGELTGREHAEELRHEVEIFKSLQHPSITKYYTSFVEDGCLYIVMELVEGLSMADFINSLREKQQKLVEGKIWRLFIELVAALRYLHVDKKVIHRDMSPSNIMVTRDLHIKIADFGLAKSRGTQSSGVMNTFVGTISYSCPEIVQSKPYNDKADIWSLGVVMYELITLKQPFAGENPLAIASQIVEEDYEPLTTEHASPLLLQIVRLCMTVNPDERPDASSLCQMIGPILVAQIDELRDHEEELKLRLKKMSDAQTTNSTRVQVNMANLRKVEDPVQPLFETLHKLIYVTQLPPGLKRDTRRSMLESFKHWLFSDASTSSRLKEELAKLHYCVREEAPIMHKEHVSYETLNFALEELLVDSGFYEHRTPISTAISPYLGATK